MSGVNPSKNKGDRAEREVVDFLDHNGFTARRITAGAHDDIGDIEVDPDIVIEVKNRYRLELPEWLRTLQGQKGNKDAAYGFIAIRFRGKTNPEEWAYVVDGATLVNLIRLIKRR